MYICVYVLMYICIYVYIYLHIIYFDVHACVSITIGLCRPLPISRVLFCGVFVLSMFSRGIHGPLTTSRMWPAELTIKLVQIERQKNGFVIFVALSRMTKSSKSA